MATTPTIQPDDGSVLTPDIPPGSLAPQEGPPDTEPKARLPDVRRVSLVGLFVLAYIGIAISLWPNIVPHQFSIWEAASSESTQAFLLVGTLFLLPIILMYSGWSYWVFRGKVRSDIGYH